MILLINPKTCKNHSKKEVCVREPNLGLLYLAAILDSRDIPVDILDLEQYRTVEINSLNELIKEKTRKYHIIGITCLTNTFHLAINIARTIKSHHPEKIVILGGPHASFQHEQILRQFGGNRGIIDFICIGEAEYSFLKLSKLLLSMPNYKTMFQKFKEKINKIKGLAFVGDKNKIVFTGFSNETIDMDSLPLPARYKLEPENYFYTVANVIVNRGCPYQCSFCTRQKLFKNRVRLRSISSLEAEIRDILSMQTYEYINFYDNLNISNDFFTAFCNMFITNQFNIPWGCELRVDKLTEPQVKLLKKAGCKLIATGIESASKTVLEMNLKKQDPQKVKKGIILLKKHELPIQAYFVVGLPGETKDTLKETLHFLKSLPLTKEDKVNFFLATPYPGSRLWNEKKEFGIKIIEKNFRKYDCEHVIFETNTLTHADLLEIKKEVKKIEQYYSPQ